MAGEENLKITESNTAQNIDKTGSKQTFRDARAVLTFRNTRKSPEVWNEYANKNTTIYEGNLSKDVGQYRTFRLNDYNWSETLDNETYYTAEDGEIVVPKIILTEFQPAKDLKWDKLVKPLLSLGGKTLDLFTKIPLVSKIGSLASSPVGKFLEKWAEEIKIGEYSAGVGFTNEGENSKVSHPALGIPVEMVKRLLSGQYLSSYEIPLFSDTYLKADTTDWWSTGGSEQILGSELSQLLTENYKVNFPMAPVWQKNGENNLEFQYDFYLINDTEYNLLKNFKFLHALISGCFWLQLGLIQKSPNLYDVEIPGRCHLYFAAMGIEINYVGRTRISEKTTNALKQTDRVYGLPDATKMLYPDAYKISVHIRDLTPNNFNMYANYFYDADKNDQVVIGSEVDRFTTGPLDEIVNISKETILDILK